MHAATPRHYLRACNYIFGITWGTCTSCCHTNTAIVILSVYLFKMTKYQFLILVLLTIFLNGTTFVISMLFRLM